MFDFTHILICLHVAHHLLVFHSFIEDPTIGAGYPFHYVDFHGVTYAECERGLQILQIW